jgi:hypothetical protein
MINKTINNDLLYELIWIVSVYVIEIVIFMLIYYIQTICDNYLEI